MGSPERKHRNQERRHKKEHIFSPQLRLFLACALLVILGTFNADTARGKTPAAEQSPSLTSSEAERTIKEFYPEARLADLKSSGVFASNTATNRWLNFSELDFNPKVAKEVIVHLEGSAEGKDQFNVSIETDNFEFNVGRKNVPERNYLIGKANSRAPYWSSNGLASTDTDLGKSYKPGDRLPYTTSFIRGLPLTPADITRSVETFLANPTALFMMEACQSVIEVARVDASNYTLADVVGQEIHCNSLGRAMTARMLGISYEKYGAWIINETIGPSDNPDLVFKPRVFSEDQYNQMPSGNQLFR